MMNTFNNATCYLAFDLVQLLPFPFFLAECLNFLRSSYLHGICSVTWFLYEIFALIFLSTAKYNTSKYDDPNLCVYENLPYMNRK